MGKIRDGILFELSVLASVLCVGSLLRDKEGLANAMNHIECDRISISQYE